MCLCHVGYCFKVLWGADGAFTQGSWQFLLFSVLTISAPFPFISCYSNLRSVLIQEQETQTKLWTLGLALQLTVKHSRYSKYCSHEHIYKCCLCQFCHLALTVYEMYSIICTELMQKYLEDYLISKTSEDLREHTLVEPKVFAGISVDSIAGKTSDLTRDNQTRDNLTWLSAPSH